ncbi:hypothetical protein HMPREF0322_03387 [Desulfitobacterium hafniense DP7]|uniref:Uncharacterized protein n=1 Tax=Desulfitobacterium hafniense DP7 TaxID=537010 RepID=G9XQY9_DESHA|nr:hypothetical protein HMPREF0322_03387 [Desulfitobacterium hafniense DP7]
MLFYFLLILPGCSLRRSNWQALANLVRRDFLELCLSSTTRSGLR